MTRGRTGRETATSADGGHAGLGREDPDSPLDRVEARHRVEFPHGLREQAVALRLREAALAGFGLAEQALLRGTSPDLLGLLVAAVMAPA
jgi:hypothetical protein